jgi:hypothetical protein
MKFLWLEFKLWTSNRQDQKKKKKSENFQSHIFKTISLNILNFLHLNFNNFTQEVYKYFQISHHFKLKHAWYAHMMYCMNTVRKSTKHN